MGTDEGGGMSFPRREILVLVWVCNCLAMPSYGAEYSMGSIGISASSVQLTAAALSCEKPLRDPALTAETAVSPIWRVDLRNIDLGYIDDDMPVSPSALGLIVDRGTSAGTEQLSSSGELGLRLDNGWSLGLTYETIDAAVQIGSAVLPDSKNPVYEGPLFVATLKFR